MESARRVIRRVAEVAFWIFLIALIPLRCASDFTAFQVVRELPHEIANIWSNAHGSAKRHAYPPPPASWNRTLRDDAAYYRPMLYFDSAERWRPLRIDDWFVRDHLQLCYADACEPLHSTEELRDSTPARRAYDEGKLGDLEIDIPGRRARDYHPPDGFACGSGLLSRFECDGAPRSAIYVHITMSSSLVYFDYWWFLRFNDFNVATACSSVGPCVDHEGDWEGVTVVVSRATGRLVEAHYSQHEGAPVRYTRSELEADDALNAESPVVYVAVGTHASYTRACPVIAGESNTPCIQVGRLRPEAPHDGAVGWYFNRDDRCHMRCVVPLDRQPWLDWPGHWGHREAHQGNAPTSPAEHDRFRHPAASR